MTFSDFSAVSELFVTAAVFYIIYQNYNRKGFPVKLAVGVALFEFFVNMLYMVSRMDHHTGSSDLPTWHKIFAASHGMLSLAVFIMLVVYVCLAYLDFKKDKYFFADHPWQTRVFVTLWTISVASGEVLYFLPH